MLTETDEVIDIRDEKARLEEAVPGGEVSLGPLTVLEKGAGATAWPSSNTVGICSLTTGIQQVSNTTSVVLEQ